MKTILEQVLLKMFHKYPSTIVPKVGSIIFLDVPNYDIGLDIKKTKETLNNIKKRLNKLSNTLSQNSFYNNAPEDVIIKLCDNLLNLENTQDIMNRKLNYLELATAKLGDKNGD